MRTSIPERNRVLVQKNTNNAFTDSNLVRTWNIDLTTEPGTIRVSPRLYINADNADDADLGLPVALLFNDDDAKYYAVCGSAVFKTSDNSPITAFAQDALANTPTTSVLYSDAKMFNGKMYVTTATDIAELSAGTWDHDYWTTTKAQAALASTRPHPLEVAQIGSPLLLIGDNNKVHTITTGGTVTNARLTLDANQVVVWIKSGTSKVYIGCVSEAGSEAFVYEWDGGDTVPTRVYNTRTSGVPAGAVLDDVLYIITANGELQVLSGGGFKTLNRFPFSRSQVPIDNAAFIYSNRRFIHPNGFIPYKGKLLALVSIQTDTATDGFTSVIENNPSGIWEFDPETNGFSHKYSVTVDKTGVKDYGQIAIPCDSSTTGRVPGALLETSAKKYASPLLVGAATWTDDATTYKTAIYNLDAGRTLTARGSVTYPKIYTENKLEALGEIYAYYERMKSSSDKLIFKYRTEINPNLPTTGAATWTSTTVFTSTNTGLANAAVGDEVEVIMGNGSGTTAHITVISYANPTYTVTVDEAVSGITANDENYVRVTNFKKLASFNDQTGTSRQLTIPGLRASTWVQVKVELRSTSGESPVIERSVILTNEHTN